MAAQGYRAYRVGGDARRRAEAFSIPSSLVLHAAVGLALAVLCSTCAEARTSIRHNAPGRMDPRKQKIINLIGEGCYSCLNKFRKTPEELEFNLGYIPKLDYSGADVPAAPRKETVEMCHGSPLQAADGGTPSSHGGRPMCRGFDDFSSGYWIRDSKLLHTEHRGWRWQLLNGRKFPLFSPEHMCEYIQRTEQPIVALIGDTTQQQLHTVFSDAMNGEKMDLQEAGNHPVLKHLLGAAGGLNAELYAVSSVCAGTAHLVFVRDELLGPGGGAGAAAAGAAPWAAPEFLGGVGTFVLQAGAAALPRLSLSAPANWDREISAILAQVNETVAPHVSRGAKVVWRTNVPGWGGCRTIAGRPPYGSVGEAEEYILKNPWRNSTEIMQQNRFWARHARRFGWLVADTYTPSILRKDGHQATFNPLEPEVPDCLHVHPLPGPILHWLAVIQNALVVATRVRRPPPKPKLSALEQVGWDVEGERKAEADRLVDEKRERKRIRDRSVSREGRHRYMSDDVYAVGSRENPTGYSSAS